MDRSTSASLMATIQIGAILIGVPVWVVVRAFGEILPFQATDLLLLVAMITFTTLVKAVRDRDDVVDSLALKQGSPLWHAHRLVDASVLGAGADDAEPTDAITPQLYRVARPRVLRDDELPSPMELAGFALGFEQIDDDAHRLIPMLPASESASTSFDATEEYIVGRGDTYWSIAETVLGDGRDWQQLQDLNLGRQVAPDTTLNSSHELRIGWSILVPVQDHSTIDEEEAHHVA